MNAYVASVIDYVKQAHGNEPEFVQTVEEVLSSVSPIMDAHPEYEKVDLLKRMVEPERMFTFSVCWMDDNGNYRLENGKPKLVTMTDTVNGHLTKNVDTFYTNGEGILTLPEKLPLGKYRIVETVGPDGFYNEWADSGNYYVDFDISTDRIYKATGDDNENGMDTLVIGEDYWNEAS